MTCAPSHMITDKHPGGAPRLYDRMKIAKDFIEYVKSHPDCLTVPCFTTTIGIDSGMMRRWALECEEFRTAFNQGKELIGINRLNATRSNQLERSIYSQVVGNFDIDINEYQREEKKFESTLKKDEQIAVSDSEVQKFSQLRKQLNELQGKSSDVKIDESKIKAEAKS